MRRRTSAGAAAGNLTVASDDVHQVASSLGADHLRQEMSDAADAEAGLAFGLAWARRPSPAHR